MFQVFRNAWMDTQLRKKILYTLFIIVLFRLGSNIFVPFLDNSAISTMMGGASLLNYLDVMTGGSLGKGTLLAMSITPYINASIIIQLLAVAIPPLEKLQKEGELRAYIAEGEILDVPTRSFGGIGIFAIPEMGRFYRHVLVEKRYPHHGAVAFGHYGKLLFDLFRYLGIKDIGFNQPKGMLYPSENPFVK